MTDHTDHSVFSRDPASAGPSRGGRPGRVWRPRALWVVALVGLLSLWAIPASAATVTATITVGDSPYVVAFTPDGTTAYVTNAGDGTVSVIDVATHTVSTTITVGGEPYGVAFTSDGTTAYVTNFGDGTVSVIDVATDTVSTTITVGTGPYGVAFTPDGTTAYVANRSDDTVSVIAVDTLPVLAAPSTLPTLSIGTHYSFTTPTSVGSPAAVFAVTAGALPDGLTLDTTTGVISGTPTTAGTFSFTIEATNTVGTVSATYTGTADLTVLAATGTDTAPLLALALALTLAGAAIMLTRRRDIRHPHEAH